MNSVELKTAIKILCKANVPSLIWGDTGIGKSTIMRDVCEELYGGNYIDLRLGQMEVGDLIGRLEVRSNRSVFMAPEWFPFEGQGILHLDEMNRAASRDVLQSIFQLIYDRKLHGHILSPGYRIFASCNPDTEDTDFQVQLLDPGLLRRFVQISYTPTVATWKKWANYNIKEKSLVKFVQENFKPFARKLNYNFPVIPTLAGIDYLDNIGQVIKEHNIDCSDKILQEICTGTVGVELSNMAVAAIKGCYDLVLSPEDILAGSSIVIPAVKNMVEHGLLSSIEICTRNLCDELADYKNITDEQSKNISLFILELPDDYAFSVMKKISNLPLEIKTAIFSEFQNHKKLVNIVTQVTADMP